MMSIQWDTVVNPFSINSVVRHQKHPEALFRVIGQLGPDMCKVTWINCPGRFAEMVNVRELTLVEVLPPAAPVTPVDYQPKTMIRNVPVF